MEKTPSISCMDGCLVVALLTEFIRTPKTPNSIKDLEENVEFAKCLTHLASHGLTFQNKGFDRHQLAITRHAFVVPAIQLQIIQLMNYSFKTVGI